MYFFWQYCFCALCFGVWNKLPFVNNFKFYFACILHCFIFKLKNVLCNVIKLTFCFQILTWILFQWSVCFGLHGNFFDSCLVVRWNGLQLTF